MLIYWFFYMHVRENPSPFHNKTNNSWLSTCGADRDNVGTPSVIFYEWEIEKKSEKATIPPQPSTLLNHQSPSDSACKSQRQFSPWLISGPPQGRGAEHHCSTWICFRHKHTKTTRWNVRKCARDLVICGVWKQSPHDDISKRFRE